MYMTRTAAVTLYLAFTVGLPGQQPDSSLDEQVFQAVFAETLARTKDHRLSEQEYENWQKLAEEITTLNQQQQNLNGEWESSQAELDLKKAALQKTGTDLKEATAATPPDADRIAELQTETQQLTQEITEIERRVATLKQLINSKFDESVQKSMERNGIQKNQRFRTFNPADSPTLFISYLSAKFRGQEYIASIENERVDKQVGATATNSGTTTIVSKGSVPAILGFAVENGAASRSVSGSTITFRGNFIGFADLLRKKGFLESYAEADPTTNFLRRLSYAVFFDPSRTEAQGSEAEMLTFTGGMQQVSGYSFRFDIVNQRDPRRRNIRQKWVDFSADKAQALNAALERVYAPILASDQYKALVSQDLPQLLTAEASALEDQVKQFATKFWELANEVNPTLENDVRAAIKASGDFRRRREEILKEANKTPIVAFEFVNERPIMGPELRTFRFIAETQLFGNQGDLTFNAGFTRFGNLESTVGASKNRDFHLAAQFDIPLGSLNSEVLKLGNTTFSLAGRYQRIFDEAFLRETLQPEGGNGMNGTNEMMNGMNGTMSGAMMMAPLTIPGDIGVFQAKITIPLKNSGIKIPISFTYSNRTELIKEQEVRGNIGLTFDLDQIFNAVRGTSGPL